MFDKDTHFLCVFYHHKQTYYINVPHGTLKNEDHLNKFDTNKYKLNTP